MTFTDLQADMSSLDPLKWADLVLIDCSCCENEFHRSKGEILKALRGGRTGVYCSRPCAGRGAYPADRRRETKYEKPTEQGPFPFIRFKDDPTLLSPYGWKDKILLFCSRCEKPHKKRREGVWQAIQKGQDGMFCSATCANAYKFEAALIIKDGVTGRMCGVCQVWRPLAKMMGGGKAKSCFYCWPKRPEQLLYRYRKGARKRGLAFDITKEQFMAFWQKPCHYCGDAIETIGIDRVDNTKGYIDGNLVPCCYRCNVMKMTDTEDDFIARCRRIVERADAHPLGNTIPKVGESTLSTVMPCSAKVVEGIVP